MVAVTWDGHGEERRAESGRDLDWRVQVSGELSYRHDDDLPD